MGAALSTPEKSIHDFTIKDCRNKDVDLSKYKGKVILIVNVAIHCSFASPHYTQLANLYSKYKDKGFEIFAFPCNQFFRQAPGTGQKSEEIVCERFNAEYPVFQKVRVNGPETAPIYKFLKASKSGIFGSGIKWNFTKFLIDKEGQVIKRYPTAIFPTFIEEDIKKALGEM